MSKIMGYKTMRYHLKDIYTDERQFDNFLHEEHWEKVLGCECSLMHHTTSFSSLCVEGRHNNGRKEEIPETKVGQVEETFY